MPLIWKPKNKVIVEQNIPNLPEPATVVETPVPVQVETISVIEPERVVVKTVDQLAPSSILQSIAQVAPQIKTQPKPIKTVVIWSGGFVRFFVVEKDLSHLHQKFMDATGVSPKIAEEIDRLIHDEKGRMISVGMTDVFPIQEVLEGAKVVVTGYLP
jgi:hypothetical protein